MLHVILEVLRSIKVLEAPFQSSNINTASDWEVMSRITILRLKTSQDNKADTHRCVLK